MTKFVDPTTLDHDALLEIAKYARVVAITLRVGSQDEHEQAVQDLHDLMKIHQRYTVEVRHVRPGEAYLSGSGAVLIYHGTELERFDAPVIVGRDE